MTYSYVPMKNRYQKDIRSNYRNFYVMKVTCAPRIFPACNSLTALKTGTIFGSCKNSIGRHMSATFDLA